MMPSGPEYFTSTLPPWRGSPMEDPSSALLTSSRLGAPAAVSRSAMAAMSSTWKPKWWRPLQSLPRSTPATVSFLNLRMARLMSPSVR